MADFSFETFLQAVLNGLALGWIYVLMALGLSLIFGVMKILQFAHGEIYMLGAYVTLLCVDFFGPSSLPMCLLVSIIATGALGFVIEILFFKYLSNRILEPISLSLGLALFLQNSIIAGFGPTERSLPRLSDGALIVADMHLPKDRLLVAIVAVLLSLILYFFLKKTKTGRAITACAQNPEGAELQGISARKMASLTMAVGSALAGAAGMLGGTLAVVYPHMGTLPGVKSLVIVTLGGMGSLGGTIVAGLIMGLIDGVGPVAFGPALAAVAPLVIVILFLLIKPDGVAGTKIIEVR